MIRYIDLWRTKMNKNIFKYVISVIGFIAILINAVNYVFNLNIIKHPIFIIGLMLVLIGMKIDYKNKK